MEFIFEDGSTATYKTFAKICGLKRKGKRPRAFRLSETEEDLYAAGDKDIKQWIDTIVLPAVDAR